MYVRLLTNFEINLLNLKLEEHEQENTRKMK